MPAVFCPFEDWTAPENDNVLEQIAELAKHLAEHEELPPTARDGLTACWKALETLPAGT